MKRYMRKSEIWTFGIGLFGVSLLTGWMPDYTYTFFNDFAFKGSGIDPASITKNARLCIRFCRNSRCGLRACHRLSR